MTEINSAPYFGELREFSGFSAKSQRYIRTSLDIFRDYTFKELSDRWARTVDERVELQMRIRVYEDIPALKDSIPKTDNLPAVTAYYGPLLLIATYDLANMKLSCFGSFRFLYERMLSAQIRPLLPSVYVAAAAMPTIEPMFRKVLLQSISEAAATAPGWSPREPVFFPEWIENADA